MEKLCLSTLSSHFISLEISKDELFIVVTRSTRDYLLSARHSSQTTTTPSGCRLEIQTFRLPPMSDSVPPSPKILSP